VLSFVPGHNLATKLKGRNIQTQFQQTDLDMK